MTPAERAELRALAEAATPGEWRAQSDRNDQPNIYGETDDQWIAILPHQCVRSIEIQAVANAAFIVAARTAVPALLDALDSVENLDDVRVALATVVPCAISCGPMSVIQSDYAHDPNPPRGWACTCDRCMYPEIVARIEAETAAAVTAWLRDRMRHGGYDIPGDVALDKAADAIERGEWGKT